jgi:hypothetical protein
METKKLEYLFQKESTMEKMFGKVQMVAFSITTQATTNPLFQKQQQSDSFRFILYENV